MHDDADEMTKANRDSLKLAIEQQRELNARQVEINAKLDVLIEVLSKALAEVGTCEIEDVPEVESIQ